MKKLRRKKTISVAIAFLLVLQLLPLNFAFGVTPSDITGKAYLSVHSTDTLLYPAGQASALKITQADGVTIISPDGSGNYADIPAGAKVVLDYAFSLEDGDPGHTVTYDYDGNEFFTATLPGGLNFATTSGTILANDAVDGNYDLASWSIAGNILTVNLTTAAEDSQTKGGAANDSHAGKWGKIHIEGSFQTLNVGDPITQTITFGSTTITINRQPLPMESTLAKTGLYDAATNEITWTVTVAPPAGDPSMAYDGFTVIDEYGANQTYTAGSFAVGGVAIPDPLLSIDAASNKVSYTFPDTAPNTTGIQTITYRTNPSLFSAETGANAATEYSTYSNTVNLKRGEDLAADPVTASVTLNWINKTGAMVDTSAADPTIAKWNVDVTVPGASGKSITGALISDTIPSDLELLTDGTHPVSIKFGSAAATTVNSGVADGEYSYAGNVLTYTFPAASQPTAGTTATLTFYTKVTAASWSTYLNNNSSISFSNSAKLSWNENTTLTYPADSFTITSGIGSGGLLSKTGGSATNYTYSSSDPGTIHWTITVNRNKIDVVNAKITDIIPVNQQLLIDATYPLTVKKAGVSVETFTSAATLGNFTYTDTNNFSYEFPEEVAGTDTISATYTVDYYTRIVEPTGLSGLYRNGTAGYTNGVTLTRTGTNVSTSATKNYNCQMVAKSVITNYNYNERTIQWQIVVNRNRLPLTNAVLTDTLPAGMTLFIDPTHLVSVTAAGGGATGTFSGVTGDTSFTLTLPTPSTDQYTITFWTKMTEEALKTQWNGTKNFTNNASLDSDEIGAAIAATATAQIKNPVISKTYSYTAGNDIISWSVVINPAQVLLQNAIVEDTLNSSLKLDTASVKLYTVLVNSSTGDTIVGGTLVDPTTYSVTLPTTANGNKLSVSLPANTSSAYRMEFSTAILTDDINLANTVSLAGTVSDSSGTSTSSQIVVNDLYSSGGSGPNTLTVHKTDSTGNPLSGAVFRLLNVNKQPITSGGSQITRTTNASGDAIFANLPSWVFYVEEIEPTTGYLIPSNPISGGNRLSGAETINVTNNLALTDVSFSKTGAAGALLSGGTFTLTGKDYALNDVSKVATAVNGVVTFTNIAPNKTGEPYTITETAAPTGHNVNANTLSASVGYNASKNSLVVNVTPNTLENTPYTGTVSFSKTGIGGAMLSGGSFTLSGTDYAGNAVNKPGVSAVNGLVTFTNVPIGSYTITEVTPPDGYLMPSSATILSATVSYNAGKTGIVTTIRSTAPGTPEVTSYSNVKALGTMSFTKLDSFDNSLLSGGTFTLMGKDYAGNDILLTSTSVGGTVTFTGVPIGANYTIKETTAPSGFKLTSNVLMASVVYNVDKTAVVTNITPNSLSNERAPLATYAKISVNKTDENGNKLAGAEFTLYDKLGTAIVKAVSDVSGVAMFDHVESDASYVIKETKAPDGYELSMETIAVTVSSSSPQSFTVVNKKIPEKPGEIKILKTDESGKALDGAEFTLYNSEGKVVGSVVTKADGTAQFSNVPVGTYTIAETLAPVGYVADAGKISVQVTSESTQSLKFINRKTANAYVGKLQLVKVDKDYHPLEGAEFTLFDKNGNVIGKAVSSSDGMATFEGLAPGEYSVKETIAPVGYKLFDKALEFQISAEELVKSYTLKDTKAADDSDVAGWSDDDKDTGGSLPKTGGIPTTFFMLLVGILLLVLGLMISKPRKNQKKRIFKSNK